MSVLSGDAESTNPSPSGSAPAPSKKSPEPGSLAFTLTYLAQLSRAFLRDRAHILVSARPANLDASEREHAAAIARDGYTLLPGFWSRDRCESVIAQLQPKVADWKDHDWDCGAYARCDKWIRGKRIHGDTPGRRRIYHVDRLFEDLTTYRNDPKVLRIAHAYCGLPLSSSMLLYERAEPSEPSRWSFHVDDFNIQLKAFLYLDDVDRSNGPFTFVRGSHRNHLRRLKTCVVGNPGVPKQVIPEESPWITEGERVPIEAEAGTLILVDTRGVHSGSLQLSRERNVLVNFLTVGDRENHSFR